MKVDEQPAGLHTYWGKPAENWYDYFINKDDFVKLFQDVANNKETIGRLTVQFAEQAVQADNDSKQLIVKQMPSDDVLFAQHKAACLWLCSMACFAALQWDFKYLLEKHDLLSVRLVVDYVVHMFTIRELVADPTFGLWLLAKFVLNADIEYRILPPAAKQTVNNPAQTVDAALIRHDDNLRCLVDLRDYMPTMFKATLALAVEGQTLYVPGFHCFLDPFIESGTPALNIGVIGHDVLVNGPPKPELYKQCDIIAARDVSNRACFDVVKTACAIDDLPTAMAHLRRITGNVGDHPLVAIDPREISGFFQAMGMPSPFRVESTREASPVTEQMLSYDDHPGRRLGVHRKRQEEQENPELKSMVRAENMARDVINGKPPLIRHLLDATAATRFAQAIVRQLPRVRCHKRTRRIWALLHFLCATVVDFTQILKQLRVEDASWLRDIGTAIGNVPQALPAQRVVNALIQNAYPYWTLMVSFDVKEIQDAVAKALPFKLPYKFRFPELLSDFVPLRPINELHVILIGKLYQLGHMRSVPEYQKLVNAVIPVIQTPNNQGPLLSKVLLEAVVVQSSKYNRIGQVSWEAVDATELTKQQRSVQNVISEPGNAQTFGTNPIAIRELLAFSLNSALWDFVMQQEKLELPIVMLSRLMAVFGLGQPLQEVVQAFFRTIRPGFETRPQVYKRGGELVRERIRLRAEFIEFFRLIREESLLTFLLSAFAHMFNHALALEKKPQLKIFVQKLTLVNAQELDLPFPHIDAIGECLSIIIQNAMEYNPGNAFWLRTAADFKYAKNEVEEAATLYMEVVLACDDRLIGPFPDNVVDDTLWSRVRVCLNRSHNHTLAALVCQMLKGRQEEEFTKTMEILAAQATLDAGADCSFMIFNLVLAELLTKVYDNNRQYTAVTKTLNWISKPAINPNNRPDILTREQGRRCEHLLRVVVANIFGTGL